MVNIYWSYTLCQALFCFLYVILHLILKMKIKLKYYYHPHFMHEETEWLSNFVQLVFVHDSLISEIMF